MMPSPLPPCGGSSYILKASNPSRAFEPSGRTVPIPNSSVPLSTQFLLPSRFTHKNPSAVVPFVHVIRSFAPLPSRSNQTRSSFDDVFTPSPFKSSTSGSGFHELPQSVSQPPMGPGGVGSGGGGGGTSSK